MEVQAKQITAVFEAEKPAHGTLASLSYPCKYIMTRNILKGMSYQRSFWISLSMPLAVFTNINIWKPEFHGRKEQRTTTMLIEDGHAKM